jgi:hypothetical protein
MELVGRAEVELRRLDDEAAELDRDRVVQTEPLPQGFTFFNRGLDADHLVDRGRRRNGTW